MPKAYEIRPSERDLYVAVDLGAGSGRVFLAGFEPAKLVFEEVSRFQYPPREKTGRLSWDFTLIFNEVKLGLKRAGERAKELGQPVRSLGVDSWAVDYGLIDANGNLLSDPICYRDERTRGVMEQLFDRVPRSTIFENTGIQFLNFNTIYQLCSDASEVAKADKMLLLPDLINFYLTGRVASEYTNATTTQLVDARTKTWHSELVEQVGLPSHIFPEIIPAGTDIGPLKPEIAQEVYMPEVRVMACASHDTASAVVGAPLAENWAYISSGTWSLIGVEQDDVLINEDVQLNNFTNEGGAFGTIRFLKNVMGLWIFESCRKEWKSDGIETQYDQILHEVASIDGFPGFIFPDDERFLNPPSMLEAIALQMRETGQAFDPSPPVVTRIILDSLAFRYASILRTIESLTGKRLCGVQIVGGGSRIEYLDQATADTSGLKLRAGPVEATALGNALVQAISTGRFDSLSEARDYVTKHSSLREFFPRQSARMSTAASRYADVESRFAAEKVVP
jgi:rhamnulokinase